MNLICQQLRLSSAAKRMNCATRCKPCRGHSAYFPLWDEAEHSREERLRSSDMLDTLQVSRIFREAALCSLKFDDSCSSSELLRFGQ